MAWNSVAPARLALLLAAVVAMVAIGVSVTRRDGEPASAMPQAEAARMAADPAALIAELERRLRGNTTDATGWRLLGRAYFATDRFDESADAYRRVTTIDPAAAEDWAALGEAIVLGRRDGVPEAAAAAFRKALAIDPGDVRSRYFLAVQKDITGDHRAAVEDWIALLKEAPPGAAWAPDVRQTVERVARDNDIAIAGLLPPAPAASPPTSPDAAIAAMPPEQQAAAIRTMVDRLAARLAERPQDPDGWERLMRARMVLGDPAAAADALAKARAANPAAQERLTATARSLGIAGA